MRNSQRFPVHIQTGWIDYSPALRYYASERIKSLLADFAPQIRSVTVRISDAEPDRPAHRRCDIDVMTTHAGLIYASSVGVDLFALLDRTVDTLLDTLRERASAGPDGELHPRVA